MGGLSRPEVPPGAQRDLVDALHDLHHRAGWPSLRALAREAGCSHTTVAAVFSSPRLPSWGVLQLVVEAMGGDVARFRRLWLAASGPEPTTEPRIAGRAAELAVVQHHLEHGSGLLLVSGEAGIGKTRLVETAAASADGTFVAGGAGLPLSAQVPLLPVADALRAVYEADEGQWVKEALVGCPRYVPAVLSRLLPELDESGELAGAHDDAWWRQRLFTAVATTLVALAGVRPLAVVIDDLQWADSTTLDLLEHLLAGGPGGPGGPGVALVGTWRLDDPTVATPAQEWLARVRRRPAVEELELAPLTREGTAEQLALLTGREPPPAVVDRVFRRTAGQPLFTDQLAAQADDRQPLPRVLADLLDRRLDGLEGPGWRVARALGVADRPLPDGLLAEVAGLTPTELTTALHDLTDRRLLHPAAGREVELRHPLLAEAIRRRLVGPESVDEHRRLARALAATGDPEPAEVAEHWQHGDEPEEELEWRVRAARAAGQRFAAAQEAEQWLRVLELWPEEQHAVGDPPLTLARACVAAMDALKASLQFDRAADLAEAALSDLTDVEPEDRAALLAQAAGFRGAGGSPLAGLELVGEALAIYETLPPSRGYVEALDRQHNSLMLLGRRDEAHRVVETAVAVTESIDAPHLRRVMLAWLGWHQADAGAVAGGLRTMAEAEALGPAESDPRADVRIGVLHTDLLLGAGAGAEAVEAVGAAALASAASAGIGDWQTVLVRANMSEALTRAGFVTRAAALIDPVTEVPFDLDRWAVHLERAHLDALRGRHAAAAERLAPLRADRSSVLYETGMAGHRVELIDHVAAIDLWAGAPDRCLPLLRGVLDHLAGTELSSLVGRTLVLAARATADLAEGAPGSSRVELVRELTDLHDRAPVDPFTTTGRADGAAHRATWAAELARLAGEPSLERWAAAAGAWDELERPHDAAYCRWRGARAALASGQGTVALRLLRRAAADAREHVPLSDAIAATLARRET